MESSTGLVAGSHNRNQLVVIRKDGQEVRERHGISSLCLLAAPRLASKQDAQVSNRRRRR